MTTHGLSTLRSANNKSGNLAITVPIAVSRALRAAGAEGSLFSCELTDDGILFRKVAVDDVALPAWAGNGNAVNE